MNFISIEFVVFLLIVIPLYFILPHALRMVLLLISSYVFYAYWEVSYLGLIVFSTLVDYLVALRLGQLSEEENRVQRRFLLALSIIVNLGVLFIFKYFNFFDDFAVKVASTLNLDYAGSSLNVLLPVGISFYTFQSMSYTIDVYRGHLKPERSFVVFATYVAFFPQLVAGPIERATNLIPQFHQRQRYVYARLVSGLRLMLWGAFKKVLIADRVAIYVNAVYSTPTEYSGHILILATLLFAIQIYCDFSGYSDIAIGTAKLMGIDLMVNFRQPYFSLSIREFWQRWHISLSTWFRDYVYIPLGGNRVNIGRNIANLMIVFVVSGLWHGANWTFVLWGAVHGIFISVEILMRHYKISLLPSAMPQTFKTLLRWTCTTIVVCLAWILFRANTLDDALYIFANLFRFYPQSFLDPFFGRTQLQAQTEMQFVLLGVAILFAVDILIERKDLMQVYDFVPRWIRPMVYYLIIIGIILTIVYTTSGSASFIYFQF